MNGFSFFSRFCQEKLCGKENNCICNKFCEMSTLDLLKISGIRSFGPGNPQVLKFQSPLTLIVGQNGSGKTTIIECLRYVSTGDLPAHTATLSKNANFVHDLNISDVNQVNSQVQLRFMDVNNERVVATRLMASTRKALPGGQKKTESKTLDGSIKRLDKRTSQPQTMQTKCLDMNREIPSLLGAPEALLNYVVFCHQEDSTWPLSEPKTLKCRFDEIFNAVKYMKALDAVKATQKELGKNIALFKSELKYLNSFKEQAEKCRNDLKAAEATLQQYSEDVNALQTEIEPIKQRLDEIGRHRAEIDRLREAIAAQNAQKVTVEKNINEMRAHIKEFYVGNIENLRFEIDRFEIDQKLILSDLNERKRELENLSRTEANLNKQRSDLLTNKGKLEAELQNSKDQVGNRDKQIIEYSAKFGLGGFSAGPFSDTKVDEFFDLVQGSKRRVNDDMTSGKASLDEQIQRAKSDAEQALNAVAANEQTTRLKEVDFDQCEKDIGVTRGFLSEMDGRQARLGTLDDEISALEAELDATNRQDNEAALKDEISKLQTERNDISSKLRSLQEELKTANREATNRVELDMFLKTKTAKENSLQKLLDKHKANLDEYFQGVQVERLRDAVEDDLSRRSKALQADLQELSHAKLNQTSKEKERDMRQTGWRAKEQEARAAEEKIEKILTGDDLGGELERIRLDVEKMQVDKGMIDGSENVYKAYISKLEDKPCCPLCERNFENAKDVTGLSDKLRRDVKSLPDRSLNLRRKIEEKQKRQAELLQLQPLVEATKNLNSTEIPTLRKHVEELNAEVRKLKKEIGELDSSVTIQADEEQTVKSIQSDIGQVDALYKEIRDFDQRAAALKEKLSLNADIRSVDAIEEDIGSLEIQLDDVTVSLETKQASLSSQQEKVQRLRHRINDLRKEKLDITDAVQHCVSYREKLATLTAKRDQYRKELDDMRQKLPSSKRMLDEARHKERALEAEREGHVQMHQKKMQALENCERSVAELNDSIRKFRYSGKPEQFNDIARKVQGVEDDISNLVRQRQTMTQQNEEQSQALSQSQMKLRDLNDSLQVKEKERAVQELELKIAKCKTDYERYGGLDVGAREYDKIVGNHLRLTKRLHEIEGRKSVLEQNVIEKRAELETEAMKDADSKHRKKVIELTTTELASVDLDKYHQAVDRAIIEYHSTQLEQVNDILRTLWQKVYKHSDIDYIAIKSAPESNTKRRAYDYRVIMQTGGAEIDMRGRCSAGQKILASLLIRIALADVFCNNCGILTLDEPTTNLDSYNSQGLAEALVELVKERSQQRNFQLVLITHDENFVRMLLQGYSMETHYRVRKDANGFSEICEMRNEDFD